MVYCVSKCYEGGGGRSTGPGGTRFDSSSKVRGKQRVERWREEHDAIEEDEALEISGALFPLNPTHSGLK